MNLRQKASAWLQRRVFKQRYMGSIHTANMSFCARVWIENWLRTEKALDTVLGRDHCHKEWQAWVRREL